MGRNVFDRGKNGVRLMKTIRRCTKKAILLGLLDRAGPVPLEEVARQLYRSQKVAAQEKVVRLLSAYRHYDPSFRMVVRQRKVVSELSSEGGTPSGCSRVAKEITYGSAGRSAGGPTP